MCVNSRFSPDTAADCSAPSSSDGNPSSSSSASPTAYACSPSGSPESLSTTTCERSIPSREPATSSPAASPVSRTARPASDSGDLTTATCGPTPFAYCERVALPSGSSRTYPVCSQAAMLTDSPCSDASSVIYPKRGSMRSGACWEQTMSVPRIGGSGCGFWPTAKGSPSGPDFARANRPGSGGDDLATAIARREWLTPRAIYAEHPGMTDESHLTGQAIARGGSIRQTYPTVTAQGAKNDGGPSQLLRNTPPLNAVVKWATPDAAVMNLTADPDKHAERLAKLKAKGINGNGAGTPLAMQVRQYPTPRSEDSQCAGRRHNRQTSDTLYAQTVTDTNSTPGSLNPTWVEWLQGFPRAWTDCEVSVTPKCLSAWRQRSRTWLARLGFSDEEVRPMTDEAAAISAGT